MRLLFCLLLYTGLANKIQHNEFQFIFQQFDMDADGFITQEEFTRSLQVHTPNAQEAFQDFLANLDEDHDSRVSFKEYCEAGIRYQQLQPYEQSHQIDERLNKLKIQTVAHYIASIDDI